ncbi:unnamed protein product [Caenorhabditis bovis]|uniref:Uncharacterized protein n=1 Tax=Caenorhabditis bovis TaxID=2654633 RepID=A0A8S1EZJ9_9PELO|nr:unnamed protein product [Caenorhabditis bovis]
METKAAVGFDATDQKFVVVPEEQFGDDSVKDGSAIDVDGRTLTVLQMCDSVDEARAACEEKANEMLNLNGMGLASITYDDEPQSSSSDTDGKEMEMENDMETEMQNEMEEDETAGITSVEIEVLANMQKQIDSIRKSTRDVFGFLMTDLKCDIDRICHRQKMLERFIKKTFGTNQDGSIIQDEGLNCELFSDGPISTIDQAIMAHYDEIDKMARKRVVEADTFLKRYVPPSKPAKTQPAAKVPTFQTKENGDTNYSFGASGNPPKRIVNGVVMPSVKELTYPFVPKHIEEECFAQANGLAPIYAQLLAKHLFQDTIELYFKEQDPHKRNWLHDAVDYRFPTPEKSLQVSKWKNCSYFINKNMREAVQISGNPMRPAPCGPRGPIGPKNPDRRSGAVEKKESEEKAEENEAPKKNGFIKSEPKEEKTPKPVLKEVQQMKSRSSSVSSISIPSGSKPPALFKFVSMSYEKECFEECRGDQYKYAELMAMRLFASTIQTFFKDQDTAKKDWLRQCVESRFPISDPKRNDQRWKVCGQMCNKNRTKIFAADGREEQYPYFPKEIEEECFRKANGNFAAYAEMMNAHLFPDTQHLFFKDQDIGKRNWLHNVLDRRFPTADKAQHISKWKACTNAINKKLSDGSVTPITPTVTTPSHTTVSNTPAVSTRSDSVDATPKSTVPKFERRSLIDGGLKRKADETMSTSPSPAAKRESARNKIKKEKEMYTAYPYVSEEEEIEIFENCNGNTQVYARELGKLLFKDTIKLYFKDQDVDKRAWIREIIDFRFPSKSQPEHKQKWKNVTAAINRNMTTPSVPPRKSGGK